MPRCRRVLVAMVACALVLVACSSDDDVEVGDADASTSVVPPPENTGPAGTAPGGGRGGVTPDPGTQANPSGDASATTGTTTTEESGPAPAPGGVGDGAPFLLRPSRAARIVLDVRAQQGAEPRAGTVDHLRAVLAEVSGKRVDVSSGVVPGVGRRWTGADLRAAADDGGIAATSEVAVLHLLFVAGAYAESDQVLGVSVRSEVAAIFSDRVDHAAGLLGNGASIEDAVTVHEAGHLLGLVDLFLDTGREDPDHPGHSRNRGSVMYYAVESTLVSSILGGGPPTEFDADDLADLAAIRQG